MCFAVRPLSYNTVTLTVIKVRTDQAKQLYMTQKAIGFFANIHRACA